MPKPVITSIAPFFIVDNVAASLTFYVEMLGFNVEFKEPGTEPFFAIVERDGAMIFLKDVGVGPLPNRKRQPWAPWDAYVSTPDPDTLAIEFTAHGVTFAAPLQDTHDGLRGFEVEDMDGYVLFFGRTR